MKRCISEYSGIFLISSARYALSEQPLSLIGTPVIFPISQFLPVLRTLDPMTRKAVFPDPRWFLEKDYHITRVGVTETTASVRLPLDILFGIEYDTDYYTSVLLIPIPLETANNMLSQIEKSDFETLSEGAPALTESSGEIH